MKSSAIKSPLVHEEIKDYDENHNVHDNCASGINVGAPESSTPKSPRHGGGPFKGIETWRQRAHAASTRMKIMFPIFLIVTIALTVVFIDLTLEAARFPSASEPYDTVARSYSPFEDATGRVVVATTATTHIPEILC